MTKKPQNTGRQQGGKPQPAQPGNPIGKQQPPGKNGRNAAKKAKAVEAVSIKPTEDEIHAKRTPAEHRFLKSNAEKRNARPEAPKIKIGRVSGTKVTFCVAGEDQALAVLSMLASFGTDSLDFYNISMDSLFNATGARNFDSQADAENETQMNGVIAAMHGIDPQDEVEGMLAAQMVATHFATMRVMHRLRNTDQIPQQDSNGNLAIKLMRTFTTQMEALQRYRGKGQQKMTVEHVHVYEGGQAIVGSVNQGGGGDEGRNQGQPHAAGEGNQTLLENRAGESQCLPSLRSEESEREALPVGRDAQRSMPDARRSVTGRAARKAKRAV